MLSRLFGLGASSAQSITVTEAHRQVTAGQAVLIDVREADEWRSGHAASARHIPLGALANRLAEVPADRPVFVICASGARSSAAVRQLQAQGRTQVSNVSGGMLAWTRQGLPVSR